MLIVKGCKKSNTPLFTMQSLTRRFLAITEFSSHLELWHKRLVYMSQRGIDFISSLKRFDMKRSKLDFYSVCEFGKQVRKLINQTSLIWWILMRVGSLKIYGRCNIFYFLCWWLFKNIWVYLLKKKSEAFVAFKSFYVSMTSLL